MEPPIDEPWGYGPTMNFDGKPPFYSHHFNVISGGMWWPAGTGHMSNPALGTHLKEMAQWHARRAIAHFADDDVFLQADAAISAGVAYELILKAHLAAINYSLLAAAGNRTSLLMLAGKGAVLAAQGTDFRSIDIKDALDLARSLPPAIRVPQVRENIVLKVRNAATHMGLVDAHELREAVVEMARVANEVIKLNDFDRDMFWGGSNRVVVDALLDQANDAIEQRLRAKIAAAEAHYERLVFGLTPELQAPLLAFLAERPTGGHGDEVPFECPACHQQGKLLCDFIDEIADTDDDRIVLSGFRIRYPYRYKCTVCNLDLYEDELSHSELFPAILPAQDEEDPDWEPDEDELRDR